MFYEVPFVQLLCVTLAWPAFVYSVQINPLLDQGVAFRLFWLFVFRVAYYHENVRLVLYLLFIFTIAGCLLLVSYMYEVIF